MIGNVERGTFTRVSATRSVINRWSTGGRSPPSRVKT